MNKWCGIKECMFKKEKKTPTLYVVSNSTHNSVLVFQHYIIFNITIIKTE